MSPSDARAQAEAESRFFTHLSAFAVAASVLVGLSLAMGGTRWAAWVGAGWALVVVVHASVVFGHVRGAEWIARRAAALRAATVGEALDALERRLAAVEASHPSDDEDPFDLDTARAAGRPVTPEPAAGPRGAFVEDDLFAAVRAPIHTPRLDGPRR